MDQIDVVGDLIHHLKIARVAKSDDAAVEAITGLGTAGGIIGQLIETESQSK